MKQIATLLSKDDFNLILNIGKLADKNNIKAYLVGGLVRDLIRGELFYVDIDIILEENAIPFARKVSNSLAKQITIFEKYGTAKVKLSDTKNIDFATCRTEVYDFPAAHPKVTFSTLKKDLFRRDFTINSIAMSINSESFGELVDPFNGYLDIKNKSITVLHDLSFIDDPNRIIRAVRFCSKLDFDIDSKTKKLAVETMNSGIFDHYMNDRIKTELKTLFSNKYKPVNNIKKLAELNSLRLFEPKLDFIKIEDFLNNIFTKIEVFEKELNIKVIQWILYTSFLLNQIEEEENYFKLVDLFKFDKIDLKIISETQNIDFLYHSLNNHVLSHYDVYHILNKYSIESIIYLLTIFDSPKLTEIVFHYFQKTKSMSINISGRDLIKMGVTNGKLIGIILEKIKEAKINGKIFTLQDELDLAKSFFP